jgi:hypothetical protein
MKDSFGNYVECVLLHRFIDWWYWNNKEVEDCPLNNDKKEKYHGAVFIDLE